MQQLTTRDNNDRVAADAGSGVHNLDPMIDAVLTTSRVLVAVAARSMASLEEEVTLTQYRTLVVLASRGPQKLTALAGVLDVTSSTATRMCDRLLRKGLIRRRTARQDRREVRLALTEAGRRLVDEVTRRRRAELRRLLSGIPVADQHAVVAALGRLNAAAGEAPDQDWSTGWT